MPVSVSRYSAITRSHTSVRMYHHVTKLMYTVRVDEPDPRFGNMLLEQFGGANGELAAAMQYSVQGINCEDPARKDLLMDIGTEELSHLEIVGADLALIGAAQRVEQIAAYTTARNLALQLHEPGVAQLLTMTLGEEQNADQLLNQVAQPLMSVARNAGQRRIALH